MLYEPYICVESGYNFKAGELHSFDPEKQDAVNNSPLRKGEARFVKYADFERGKLRELANLKLPDGGFFKPRIEYHDCFGFVINHVEHGTYHKSCDLICYPTADYEHDTESDRLLKRAEFLKAVCERENVEWLPDVQKMHITSEEPKSSPDRFHELTPEERQEGREKVEEAIKGDCEPVASHSPGCNAFHGLPCWYGNRCPCSCHPKPERDYYTKDEVGDLIASLVRVIRRNEPLSSHKHRELGEWLLDWLKLRE